jgi:hypothetical protein
MRTFLIECVGTVTLIGVPTLFIWVRSGRKIPFMTSYKLALLYMARIFGFLFMALSGMFFIFSLADQLGLTRFGYPPVALFMALFFALIGYGIWRCTFLFGQLERRQN